MENQKNKIMEENNNQEIENTKSEKKPSFLEKVIAFIKKDKKRSIIIGCAIVVVIVLGTIIGVLSNSSSDYENEENNSSSYSSEEETEENTSSSTSQSTSSYDTLTTDELLELFRSSFTVSNVKQSTKLITFNISTGETIYGYINNNDKVTSVKVHVSGNNMPTLLEEKYHYYPLCHFLSNIKGETVTADEIIEILTSVEPTSSQGKVSISMSYTAKRNNIQYELTATQYTVNNYCTLEISATIL